MKNSIKLRRSVVVAVLAVLAALLSMTAATFAWYVYNTASHTTEVKISAGGSVSLQISKDNVEYGSAVTMDKCSGLIPISSDRILMDDGQVGFQRVGKYHVIPRPTDPDLATDPNKKIPDHRLVVDSYEPIHGDEYYKTTLYLHTNANNLDVYLAHIGYEEDLENPMSTALRVGLVVNEEEFIYEVNPEQNPSRTWDEYPQDNGMPDPESTDVLDSSRPGGKTTGNYRLLTRENLCDFDIENNAATKKENSTCIGTLSGDGKGGFGEPLKVDVYLWLEGCDPDCTLNLGGQSMDSLALFFAGL